MQNVVLHDFYLKHKDSLGEEKEKKKKKSLLNGEIHLIMGYFSKGNENVITWHFQSWAFKSRDSAQAGVLNRAGHIPIYSACVLWRAISITSSNTGLTVLISKYVEFGSLWVSEDSHHKVSDRTFRLKSESFLLAQSQTLPPPTPPKKILNQIKV